MKGILPVLGQYPITVRSIAPVQEDVYFVEANQGKFCLKCANKGEHKMLFIYSVLKHLVEDGFPKVSAPVPTKNGSPLVKAAGHIYLLTEWVSGVACDFDRDHHLTAAARTLAEFHQHAKGIKVLTGAKARSMYEKWPKILENRVAELKIFQNTVRNKNSLTDFEKKYLAYADSFIEKGSRACSTLKSSAYHKIAQEAEAQKTFTHRDVAARNFIIGRDGEAYMIDFDYCRYDLRVTDVVRLVERTLRNVKWDFGKAVVILDNYNKIYPLEKEQYQIMLAFFQFPQKFWRISQRYFKKKQRWQEEGYLKKLASVTRKLQYQDQFIRSFEKHYC